MKLWSTTPDSNRRHVPRVMLVGVAVVMAVSTPLAITQQALADKYDQQISNLQSQASQYQAQASQLRAQGDTLQNKLNEITAQKNALQAQIDANTAKRDQLIADIAVNQKKMDDQQSALGDTIANMYVDGKVTTLEMLASSSNVGDYVDKQQFRSSVKDQLTKMISAVKKLKKQLETDKTTLENTLSEMNAQSQQLASLQAQQQQLVDQTRGEEAAYQQLVNSTKSQMADVASQQRAYYQSLIKRGGGNAGVVGQFKYSNWSGNRGCGAGGYPYCGGQDTYADPWGLYNRECVSYVAWALSARFGKYVGHFAGQGNAGQWTYSAISNSGATRVYSPQPGDAVILPAMQGFAPVGHAMIVESVDGDTMHVSQYNFYGTGEYSTMDVKNSGVVLLRFHDK